MEAHARGSPAAPERSRRRPPKCRSSHVQCSRTESSVDDLRNSLGVVRGRAASSTPRTPETLPMTGGFVCATRWSDPRNGLEAKGSLEGPAGQPHSGGAGRQGTSREERALPSLSPSTFAQVDYPLDFGSISFILCTQVTNIMAQHSSICLLQQLNFVATQVTNIMAHHSSICHQQLGSWRRGGNANRRERPLGPVL